MAPIKLIALDLDGTLLMDDHETVSPANRAALDEAAAHGIHVVAATGRSLSAVAPAVRAIPYIRYFITCNGSSVTRRDGTVLRRAALPYDITEEILAHLEREEPELLVELCAGGQMFLSRAHWERREELHLPPYHLHAFRSGTGVVVENIRHYAEPNAFPVEKVNLPFVTPEQKASVKAWGRERFGDALRMVSTLPYNLEINDRRASKSWGLRQVCEILGLSPAECIAFGDADNDTDMIKLAGIGVAMGNALDEVKAAADFVTRRNEEDGVAFAVRHLGVI